MRARRKIVVASLLVSLIGALWLGAMAIDAEVRPTTYTADPGPGNQVGGPANVDPNARAAQQGETGSPGTPLFLLWLGAFASGIVFLASFIVFRVEVRREKSLLRARKSRDAYFRDLRRYNAQLKGPPRNNT